MPVDLSKVKEYYYLTMFSFFSQVDQFNHQSASAMVRQHLDSGGFYEPDTHRMREVKNVTYVTTVNPMTPASVPSLNPRLVRHFAVLGMPYPK